MCSPVCTLIDHGKLTNQIARLVAIVVKIKIFAPKSSGTGSGPRIVYLTSSRINGSGETILWYTGKSFSVGIISLILKGNEESRLFPRTSFISRKTKERKLAVVPNICNATLL